MMRNTISRPAAPVSTPHSTQANPGVPSIRLIAATPSASGLSSEANTSMNSSWASVPSIPSPLAPKNDDVAPRKRLVPKKSKLGLLGVGSSKEKEKERERGKDLSDVVRRVGASSSSRRGFDIYVDPTDDPEIGEILMVKKKKSRAGLDGMRWGTGGSALEEVTNVPSVTPPVVAMLKPKAEGKEKWWSIGRGRKDSKENEKEKEKEKSKVREKSKTRPELPRSKTPEPFKSIPDVQSRARFNSLDSGIVLNSPTFAAPVYDTRNISSPQLLNINVDQVVSDDFRPPPINTARSATPTMGGLLAPPLSAGTEASNNQGSIAIRAMRSMRSLARIGSWAQLKNGAPDEENVPLDREERKGKENDKKPKAKGEKKFKDKDESKEKKRTKKEKDDKKEKKARAQTVRASSSSFEAGALTASPEATQTMMRKKRSILGLGLPSTMRLPTVRSGSTTSSIGAPSCSEGIVDNNRLSVESAVLMTGRARSGSCLSTASSLRPLSTTSSNSRTSSGSSAASIRWDEEGLETVREQRRRERESKRIIQEQEDKEMTKKKKGEKDSRRVSGEGRRRTPLSEVFPDIHSDANSPRSSTASSIRSTRAPLLTLEEATNDGHDRDSDSAISTPARRRPRPMSEQMLGRSRPQPVYDEEGEGVISILSAATNDLAQLINHLDLEATPGTTPGTPNMSPWREQMLASLVPRGPDNDESPTKKTLRRDISSITSLRPYAQSRTLNKQTSSKDLLGQQIAPWPTLNSMFPKDSPKASPPAALSSAPKTRPNHKRTLSPPAPMLENSPPMIRPLRPARSRSGIIPMKPLGPPPTEGLPPIESKKVAGTVRAPSTLTFGSRTSSRGPDSSISSMDDINNRPPVPVLPSAFGHARNRSSLLSSQCSSEDDNTTSRPLAPGARRMLGMKGTMGGSDVSAYAVDELDASDPDSDIPDELQNILAKRYEDDTLSYRPSSPATASPQGIPEDVDVLESSERFDIPMFHLTDVNENQIDMDDIHSDEEGDTKKSFDFTGELQKLNESGASDRRSFMEQLENAFRTPAKLDLCYDFGGDSGMLNVLEVPPIPPLPSLPAAETSSSTIQTDISTTSHEAASGSSSQTSDMENYPVSRLLDVKEPTLLAGSDSVGSNAETDDLMVVESAEPSMENVLPTSRPSDGQLNKAFKFGGMPKASSSPAETEFKKESKITLSDIIPPPSHLRSVSNASSLSVGDSVINSIIAEAAEMPLARPRARVNSDSSIHVENSFANTSAGRVGMQIQYRHSRMSSEFSFTGFDSFDEVRRGFEFHDYRPGFYPPPASNNRRRAHNRHESTFSIASISSYGHVLNPGVPDPFDYGLPSLRERPSSEDMTMSMSMSQSIDDTFSFIHRAPRRRVESDASSFYFNAPSQSFKRGHGRNESNMSILSGPPVSLYNRSFGAHRRNDSNTSVSSMAHSYALHGASGGRAAWARHRQDGSVDSVNSQFSAMRLGRPGVGDKMFETAGVPLTSISASPTDSAVDLESRLLDSRMEQTENTSSFDSIMDTYQRSSIEMEDSLFDKTGDRGSVSSDSVFGYDFSRFPEGHLLPPPDFRPMSSFSISSVHSPAQEDDTMISMIGGGHVRRRSVGSAIDASPCVRFGNKRKQPPSEAAQKENQEPGHAVKARIVEKASIASTSSSKFGGERMIKARKGLLERQSLEESVLMAEGEDNSISFSSVPVFSRPGPASRSRSSTCTSMSSGVDTPPLSPSDGSMSMSDGSQSSIDIAHLNSLLVNATHPVSTTGRNRLRARARGQGHRRRISQARMSRSSVYETIEEEYSSDSSSSPDRQSKKSSPTAIQPVFVVNADTASIHSNESFWDDERGIVALRKYYDLRDEAEYTVSESKRVWVDTPFSVYALQTFNPPKQPSAMQALLQDSMQNYHPLPSELRPRRRRAQSRPSPYPQGRTIKVSLTSDSPRSIIESISPNAAKAKNSALQEITVNSNIMTANHMPKYEAKKPFATLEDDLAESLPAKTRENAFGLASQPRPRVGSSARRSALGWSKRSSGKASSELKENAGVGVSMTPGESLRLNRPRPRGRPTPARSSIRV